MSEAAVEASYGIIDERSLSVAPLKYRGMKVKLSGQVTNISQGDEGTWMTLRIGAFPHFATVVVRYPGPPPNLRKDMTATVYGVCAGTERVRYQSEEFLGFIGLTVSRPLVMGDFVHVGTVGPDQERRDQKWE